MVNIINIKSGGEFSADKMFFLTEMVVPQTPSCVRKRSAFSCPFIFYCIFKVIAADVHQEGENIPRSTLWNVAQCCKETF